MGSSSGSSVAISSNIFENISFLIPVGFPFVFKAKLDDICDSSFLVSAHIGETSIMWNSLKAARDFRIEFAAPAFAGSLPR